MLDRLVDHLRSVATALQMPRRQPVPFASYGIKLWM